MAQILLLAAAAEKKCGTQKQAQHKGCEFLHSNLLEFGLLHLIHFACVSELFYEKKQGRKNFPARVADGTALHSALVLRIWGS